MVDWYEYSKTYDLLLEYNPAYQEIINDFHSFLDTISPPKRALDIGAGTGNYSLSLLQRYPDCVVDMVEPDAGMAELAKAKTNNYPSVNIIQSDISKFEWSDYDLVIAVHSLYVIPSYMQVLDSINSAISSNSGSAYLCDIGRVLDVKDWRSYIAKSILRKHGLMKAISVLWQGRMIAKENFNIREKQISGDYWTHSPEVFKKVLSDCSLVTTDFTELYRGYSDRAIVVSSRDE